MGSGGRGRVGAQTELAMLRAEVQTLAAQLRDAENKALLLQVCTPCCDSDAIFECVEPLTPSCLKVEEERAVRIAGRAGTGRVKRHLW